MPSGDAMRNRAIVTGLVVAHFALFRCMAAEPIRKPVAPLRPANAVAKAAAPAREPAELKTWRALQRRVSVKFEHEPLSEVVKELSARSGVNLLLDPSGLRDEGVTQEIEISITANDARLATLLDQILTPLHLDFAVANEAVKITGRQRARGEIISVSYPIRDLAMRVESGRNVPDAEEAANLIDTITSTIAPDSWEERGGPGSVTFSEKSISLVVRQTQEVQRDILGMLNKIHRERQSPTAGRTSLPRRAIKTAGDAFSEDVEP
jgi:hypothetical protein